MKQRISPKVDFDILKDLSLGVVAKDIAKKYGVSISYVSKVKTGRKKIEVYIPEQVKEASRIEYYKSDIDKLTEFFSITPLSLQSNDSETLDSLIVQKMSELKVLLMTRKLLVKEEN